MTLTGLQGRQYSAGREIGRGGEGVVYEVAGDHSMVVKVYAEALSAQQERKLAYMVSIRNKAIEAYAAWPVDVVYNSIGAACGFVMRKLTGYMPLHMIFSPMDRKRLFPDKGYNFLAHVARNLATAFYKLHEAGLIVGDVNEGNILISGTGLVAFIDCDSFQVTDRAVTYYCEVGIPRYTPPELLAQSSFANVVRTVNTDSFSMAVLIFQLLFLGRHPFAGRNKTTADIDEETAIKMREFAYSLDQKKKKLSPPPDSFSMHNLPGGVIELFHRAFEHDGRPTPAEWVMALEDMLRNMITCQESKLHSYPAAIKECPWCYFRKSRGIVYFLDDSYLNTSSSQGDIEQFVNGFKIEQLELKKWNGNITYRALTARQIPAIFHKYRRMRMGVSTAIAISGIVISMAGTFSLALILIMVVLGFLAYRYMPPWTRRLKQELQNRAAAHNNLRIQLRDLIAEYDNPADLPTYTTSLNSLNKLVLDFRALPEETERKKKLMEEDMYNAQLNNYLAAFAISDHTISSIGSAKKQALISNGIMTAADIEKLARIKVPGIGAANQQVLYSWRRQMSTGFVYIPDSGVAAIKMQKVTGEIITLRSQLETAIRREYKSLNYLKLNITNRAAVLDKQINDLSLKAYQARLDMESFRRFAA